MFLARLRRCPPRAHAQTHGTDHRPLRRGRGCRRRGRPWRRWRPPPLARPARSGAARRVFDGERPSNGSVPERGSEVVPERDRLVVLLPISRPVRSVYPIPGSARRLSQIGLVEPQRTAEAPDGWCPRPSSCTLMVNPAGIAKPKLILDRVLRIREQPGAKRFVRGRLRDQPLTASHWQSWFRFWNPCQSPPKWVLVRVMVASGRGRHR